VYDSSAAAPALLDTPRPPRPMTILLARTRENSLVGRDGAFFFWRFRARRRAPVSHFFVTHTTHPPSRDTAGRVYTVDNDDFFDEDDLAEAMQLAEARRARKLGKGGSGAGAGTVALASSSSGGAATRGLAAGAAAAEQLAVEEDLDEDEDEDEDEEQDDDANGGNGWGGGSKGDLGAAPLAGEKTRVALEGETLSMKSKKR
jgi:hypothetical protein